MIRRYVTGLLGVCAGLFFPSAAVASEQQSSHTVTIPIRYEFAGKPLEFHRPTQLTTDTKVAVTRLEFIISNVRVDAPDAATTAGGERYFHLNPLEQDGQLQVDVPADADAKSLTFDIGVPQAINHDDPARFPAGHPLNVLECNLYWSWNVGYVFLALEGTSQHVSEPKKTFLYHLGNDPLLMHVRTNVPPGISFHSCELVFDLAKVWNGLEPQAQGGLTHSAAGDTLAPQLAKNIEYAFQVRQRAH